MKQIILWFLTLVCSYQLANADDIARDVRHSGSGPDNSNGGYFELGFGLTYFVDPFIQEDEDCGSHTVCPTLLIGGSYHYRGAFIELADTTADGLNLGYSLWGNARWTVDFIGLNVFGDIHLEPDKKKADTEFQRDYDLLYRSRLTFGTGTRVTGYFDNSIAQFRLLTDLFSGHGFVSSLRLGHSWQYRNWNFHSILSADWFSSEMVNYWVGVTDAEATARFPTYRASSTVFFSGELGLAYPVTEHWVARAYMRYSPLSSTISDSPLVDEKYGSVAAMALSYAF